MSDIINQNTEPLFIFDMPDDETLSETISVKGEKGERGDPTKLSDLENDEGFINANTDALVNYYTKSETDAVIDEKIGELGVPDGFFTAANTVTGTGSNITLADTADARLASVVIYGDTLQNGSPTPSSPVDVQVATGEQTVTISGTSSQTYALDLGDMELCKIGDNKDYIYKNSGKWYKHKVIGKLNLGTDVTEWGSLGTNTSGYSRWAVKVSQTDVPANASADVMQGFSSHFVCGTRGQTYARESVIALGNNDNYYKSFNFYVGDLAQSNVQGLKEWLAENTPTVYYVSTDPTDQEITDDALIAQLDALRAARSYAESTTIAVTGDLPVLLSATAYRDNWSGTIDGIANELTDVVASDAQKATKSELKETEKSYVIDEITVDEYYDEQRLTHYWVSHIPPKDADGNDIKMQLGLAKDAADTSLRANETARSFAKRKNATLCINAGTFSVYDDSAYKGYPIGIVVKDGAQVCDYRSEMWDEGIMSHTYLQSNRMLGVKSDGSLERFNYDVSAAALAAAGVDFTVTGFGAFMKNGKLTYDLSHTGGNQPTTYTQTVDATPNINKIYFTLEDTEYVGHWRLTEFEAGVTYYEQATGDFYQWQFLGQNTTTKDIYVFTCNGKGNTTEKGMSFEQGVAILRSLGCDYGFQLDGGGSTGTYYNGTRLNNKTDSMTHMSPSTDGRGYDEREMPTFLYWAKEPKTDVNKTVANINKVISDINNRLYDLELDNAANDEINSDRVIIKNDTGSDGTGIHFSRSGSTVYSIIADYLQQGILALWDARESRTVLRVYPTNDDGIAYLGNKLALLYDQVPLLGSSTDLDNLVGNTQIARLQTNYNLTNQPYDSTECYHYIIAQFAFTANNIDFRVQVAFPLKASSDIGSIKIRSYTGQWSTWTFIGRPKAGSTSARPTNYLSDGMCFFDTTLGKPIWYNGGNWYDATGTQV